MPGSDPSNTASAAYEPDLTWAWEKWMRATEHVADLRAEVDHWAETVGGEGIPVCGPDCDEGERAVRRKTHDTIRRATVDIEERMNLNTAISSLMELVNELYTFSATTPHGAPSKSRRPDMPRWSSRDCPSSR